jgi:polyisoprenoid-binding protein YceI
MKRLLFIVAAGAGLALAVSCAPSNDAQSATVSTTTSSRAVAIADAATTWATRYVVAPAGNEVRYRVREQLAGFDLPNDAVGKSSTVSGAIAFDADGRLLRDASRFTVDASTFVSDRDRRDRYVGSRLLEAQRFPEIVLVPTALRGVTLPLASAGSSSFELVGDLTVRGVTRPTVWRVTAQLENGRVSGTASTRFVFDDFQMEKPRVRSVLSVADTIALEYDFSLVREGTQSAR